MGGGMPFHLEKGVIGLRLDYLTRSPAVRAHVLARLQGPAPGNDPYVIAASINIPGVPIINIFNDKKAEFFARLSKLAEVDPTPPNPNERRSGAEYLTDQGYLLGANQDSTGNRDSFRDYWVANKTTAVVNAMRTALITALTSGRDHIDFWWDCSLPDPAPQAAPEPPTVICSLDSPHVARVLFITDHSPIQPPTTPIRAPLDDDPVAA